MELLLAQRRRDDMTTRVRAARMLLKPRVRDSPRVLWSSGQPQTSSSTSSLTVEISGLRPRARSCEFAAHDRLGQGSPHGRRSDPSEAPRNAPPLLVAFPSKGGNEEALLTGQVHRVLEEV